LELVEYVRCWGDARNILERCLGDTSELLETYFRVAGEILSRCLKDAWENAWEMFGRC